MSSITLGSTAMDASLFLPFCYAFIGNKTRLLTSNHVLIAGRGLAMTCLFKLQPGLETRCECEICKMKTRLCRDGL